jgi:hypothetical protein
MKPETVFLEMQQHKRRRRLGKGLAEEFITKNTSVSWIF